MHRAVCMVITRKAQWVVADITGRVTSALAHILTLFRQHYEIDVVGRFTLLLPACLLPVRTPGVLEKLRVRTIGVKDMLTEKLAGMPLPLEFFTGERLRTKE